jgi:hypothetical protein
MMDRQDDRFEELLRDAARDYHRPPETPRDAMWARIAAERERRAARRAIVFRPWARWTLAAAAVLVLGIGIGRWSIRDRTPPGGTSVAAADVPGNADVAYQVAATQYLSRTEAFLTAFRSDQRTGRTQARFASQANDLLTTTRLMLDSPAADDPRLRMLLEDLELVLVQISQLEAGRDARDADLITEGMDQRHVLPKLRSAIPAGPVPMRTEGVL